MYNMPPRRSGGGLRRWHRFPLRFRIGGAHSRQAIHQASSNHGAKATSKQSRGLCSLGLRRLAGLQVITVGGLRGSEGRERPLVRSERSTGRRLTRLLAVWCCVVGRLFSWWLVRSLLRRRSRIVRA